MAEVPHSSRHQEQQTNTALDKAGCKRIFQEKISGADRNRPELKRLLDQLRHDYEVETKSDDFIPMTDVFLELLDATKPPAIALRGFRRKEGLSQTSLAKMLGV